ncbi:hypothetical protein N8I74_07390 [Chitiniphilus purpureus]|uniref:DUF3592 domain-containing protein n=1 Tax=Chitiniphilus purpureus TaxID=2981137 RepID=A0ABY6DR48_9NEIS|nr:hypothetical protein [Chitiniphilus sp. CD1]UXY16831.1 hypothetical protein N8I74_07390 [Chitiniphilus sp. CD1]
MYVFFILSLVLCTMALLMPFLYKWRWTTAFTVAAGIILAFGFIWRPQQYNLDNVEHWASGVYECHGKTKMGQDIHLKIGGTSYWNYFSLMTGLDVFCIPGLSSGDQVRVSYREHASDKRRVVMRLERMSNKTVVFVANPDATQEWQTNIESALYWIRIFSGFIFISTGFLYKRKPK